MIDKIRNIFEQRYCNLPIMYSAAGRVNLIGEHTDYNEGFVLPASVDKRIVFAIKPNNLQQYRFFAADLNDEYIANSVEISNKHWANYLLGVINQFAQKGINVPTFDCVFGGNVPLGAGMSSSAAIEVGMAYALNDLFGFGFQKLELTKFAQMAEHTYANVKCGIMDQFASMFGKKNSVIKLDCRTYEYEYFPLNMENHVLVLVNTGVKHSLASSEYNKRRRECEEAVEVLQKYNSGVKSLRDATLSMIEAHSNEMSVEAYLRSTYIVEENLRVVASCKALADGDFVAFGKYLYQSHAGLSEKYQVSCAELDKLVDIAQRIDGVLGSRMMGGGFGGCTISLVEKSKLQAFESTMRREYKTPDGNEPIIYDVVVDEGACKIIC